MKKKLISFFIFALLVVFSGSLALAQDQHPVPPPELSRPGDKAVKPGDKKPVPPQSQGRDHRPEANKPRSGDKAVKPGDKKPVPPQSQGRDHRPEANKSLPGDKAVKPGDEKPPQLDHSAPMIKF